MKTVIHITLVAAVLTLLTVSCVLDREYCGYPLNGDGATLLLRFQTPGDFAAAPSRALTIGQENAINTIHVLVFDNTNELVDIKQGRNVSSTPGHDDPNYSGSGSFSVTLAASRTTADTYRLVVLANAQMMVSALGGVRNIADRSYAAVTASLWARITEAMYPSGGEIPMWGEIEEILVEPGDMDRSMRLRRAVARVDVGVGRASRDSDTRVWSWDGRDAANAEIPLELAHVHIVRPNDRYAAVPDLSKAAGEPTVPSGTAAFPVADSKAKFAFTPSNGCVTQSIYVPEADIRMGSAGKPGDANHNDRMAVVVGGYYDGSPTETFYRLDFLHNGNLVDVMRNRLYRFSILNVYGAGHPDLETAYGSLAMNMTAEVLDWDVTDMGGIVFDGQYALSVGGISVELHGQAYTATHTENKLRIRTDWTGGYAVESIIDVATSATATWLSIADDEQTGTDKTVSLILAANDTGAPRSAKIRITAGRMATEVTVTQGLPLPPPAVLTHTSNTLPASGIIPHTGGIYAIDVTTNLQSWGVRVYEGTNTTPLVIQPANPLPAIDRNAEPVASTTSFAIPATAADRSLTVMLYADQGAESRAGSVMQHAYHWGDLTAANRRITWDGSGYSLTADPNDAGLYFKFGSVAGLFSAHHANQVLPGTGTDGFDPGDIAWNPTNATGWSTVPVYSDHPNAITPESGYHTAANVRAGKGDPCRLVGLDLNKIMNTDAGYLTTADIDNGVWRLPTLAENRSFSGYGSLTNTAAHWLTLIGYKVIGGMFPDPSSGSVGTFLPAAGHRLANNGAVSSQGSYGNYWTSDPNISARGYMLSFNNGSVSPTSSNSCTFGFSIRCVRQ